MALEVRGREGGRGLAPLTGAGAEVRAGGAAVLQTPPSTFDSLAERFDRLSERDRIVEYFYDPNTGLPNEVAFEVLHGASSPDRPYVGHYSIEGPKYVNDAFTHEQGQELYKMAAQALHACDSSIAKVRGDFGNRVASLEAAQTIAEQANKMLPPEFKGFKITAWVGSTIEKAAEHHGHFKDVLEKGRRRAVRGQRPLGIGKDWTPATRAFPGQKVEQPLHRELVAAYRALDRATALGAYRDPMTGLLSSTGMGAVGSEGRQVLSIDLDGLKASDQWSSGLADEVIRRVGTAMRLLGGDEVCASHPHGDEYGAVHANAEVLQQYAEEVKEYLRDVVVTYVDLERGKTYTQKGVGVSFGIGANHDEAERALQQHKDARALAGERDRKGESEIARLRLTERDATPDELRAARARQDRLARTADLGAGHERGGVRAAHEGDDRRVPGRAGREERVTLGTMPDPAVAFAARGIRPETLEALPFRGRWRMDGQGNLEFPHSKHVLSADRQRRSVDAGMEVVGKADLGPSKDDGGIWQSAALGDVPVTRVVVTDRVIDAISYHQMRPDPATRYVSVGDALTPERQRALSAAIEEIRSAPGRAQPLTVVTAFGRTREAPALERGVQAALPAGVALERDPPSRGRGWNEVVQGQERDWIRAQGIRQVALGRELNRA